MMMLTRSTLVSIIFRVCTSGWLLTFFSQTLIPREMVRWWQGGVEGRTTRNYIHQAFPRLAVGGETWSRRVEPGRVWDGRRGVGVRRHGEQIGRLVAVFGQCSDSPVRALFACPPACQGTKERGIGRLRKDEHDQGCCTAVG